MEEFLIFYFLKGKLNKKLGIANFAVNAHLKL